MFKWLISWIWEEVFDDNNETDITTCTNEINYLDIINLKNRILQQQNHNYISIDSNTDIFVSSLYLTFLDPYISLYILYGYQDFFNYEILVMKSTSKNEIYVIKQNEIIGYIINGCWKLDNIIIYEIKNQLHEKLIDHM